MNSRQFGQLLVAALLGGLVAASLPAMGAVLNQSIGDAFSLGNVNKIDERTDLKGDAKGANLQIKNTGNAGALSAKAGKNAIKAKATSGPVAVNATASRNAVKIKVDAGQSPITVNATAGTAENLSADLLDGMDSSAFLGAGAQAVDSDQVDGRDADGLVRVAFERSGDLPDGDDGGTFTSGFGSVLPVTITAPTAGWLVITGAIDAFNTSANNTYSCRILLDEMVVTGSLMSSQLDGGSAVNDGEDCTTHAVEEVAAGDHDVALSLASVASTTDFLDGTLSVLFIPFDGVGTPSDL
jgi:hypothetical protein